MAISLYITHSPVNSVGEIDAQASYGLPRDAVNASLNREERAWIEEGWADSAAGIDLSGREFMETHHATDYLRELTTRQAVLQHVISMAARRMQSGDTTDKQ